MITSLAVLPKKLLAPCFVVGLKPELGSRSGLQSRTDLESPPMIDVLPSCSRWITTAIAVARTLTPAAIVATCCIFRIVVSCWAGIWVLRSVVSTLRLRVLFLARYHKRYPLGSISFFWSMIILTQPRLARQAM